MGEILCKNLEKKNFKILKSKIFGLFPLLFFFV